MHVGFIPCGGHASLYGAGKKDEHTSTHLHFCVPLVTCSEYVAQCSISDGGSRPLISPGGVGGCGGDRGCTALLALVHMHAGTISLDGEAP